MDIFVEEMVQKKKSVIDLLLILFMSFSAVLITFVILTVVLPKAISYAPVLFLLIAAIFYLAYLTASSTNVEFEYSLVNNEIDIDKITNKKKRKRLTTVKLRNLESFGRLSDGDFLRYSKDPIVKKVFASVSRKDEDNFFLVYTENTIKKLVVFTPSEKIVEIIEKLNPKKV